MTAESRSLVRRRLLELRGLRHRRKRPLALRLDESGRHDELRGVVSRDRQFDDLIGRNVKEEASCRIGRAGHEHGNHRLLSRERAGDDFARGRRDEHDRPAPFDREFDQPHLPKLGAGLAEHRLEDLLQALVHAPDERRAVEHRLAQSNQRAADDIGGQESEQRQTDERDHDPEARNVNRQIGVRGEALRKPGLDPVVDRVDRPPGNVGGDSDRSEYDKAGEEPRPQPRRERAVERCGRLVEGHEALVAAQRKMAGRRDDCKNDAPFQTARRARGCASIAFLKNNILPITGGRPSLAPGARRRGFDRLRDQRYFCGGQRYPPSSPDSKSSHDRPNAESASSSWSGSRGMPRRYFHVGASRRSLAASTALCQSSASKSPRPIHASATSAAASSTSRSLMNSMSSRRMEALAPVRTARSPSSAGFEASGSTPTSPLNSSRDFSITKHTFARLISGIGRSPASILRIGRPSFRLYGAAPAAQHLRQVNLGEISPSRAATAPIKSGTSYAGEAVVAAARQTSVGMRAA